MGGVSSSGDLSAEKKFTGSAELAEPDEDPENPAIFPRQPR